ncbi:UNVERIFIED_CONTAM: hypothetical protein Sradi_0178100 [Sesamum radiatum]|uniref:Uncharacterized protein n=1 Tax=Sesamum radiatum TaxID=300843 RepID=A0AAW2W305_SESRA
MHYNRDKGMGMVIEESEDGERADWVGWDRDDEDMREPEECVTNSEDDLFNGDESVDYDENDECFEENVENEAEWAGILQDDFEDEMRFDNDDHTDGDNADEFDSQKNSHDDNVDRALVFYADDTFDHRFALGMKFSPMSMAQQILAHSEQMKPHTNGLEAQSAGALRPPLWHGSDKGSPEGKSPRRKKPTQTISLAH